MIKFHTIYNSNERGSYISPSGSPYVQKKVISVNKDDGCEYLKEVGCYNLYERIQSHRESCDLNLILSELDPLQVNGMLSTFTYDDVLDSSFYDVSTLPKNPGEMLNLVKEGQQLFDGLPLEVRKEFNFSPNLFISSFGTDDFLKKINNGYGISDDTNSINNNLSEEVSASE